MDVDDRKLISASSGIVENHVSSRVRGREERAGVIGIIRGSSGPFKAEPADFGPRK